MAPEYHQQKISFRGHRKNGQKAIQEDWILELMSIIQVEGKRISVESQPL